MWMSECFINNTIVYMFLFLNLYIYVSMYIHLNEIPCELSTIMIEIRAYKLISIKEHHDGQMYWNRPKFLNSKQ